MAEETVELRHLTDENRETVVRLVNNLSRAQHGALDTDEALDQFLEDLDALVSEVIAPQSKTKGDKIGDKPLKIS